MIYKCKNILILIIFFALFACNKEERQASLPPIPTCPAFDRLTPDFCPINDTTKNGAFYWESAQSVICIWDSIFYIDLNIIATALQEIEYAPFYKDRRWINVSTFVCNQTEYATHIHAYQFEDLIEWRIYIGKESTSDLPLLISFSTNSESEIKNGTFINPLDSIAPFITFSHNAIDSICYSMLFSYVNEQSTNSTNNNFWGSSLLFKKTNSKYNREVMTYFYEQNFFNTFHKAEIEWNNTEYYGRIKYPEKTGDSQWHTWNTFLENE